jgi:hypothetical protein
MPGTLQQFLATATPNAATVLETALLRLPEDKRGWSPMGDARTALDMIAECALLNDVTEIVRTRTFDGGFDFGAFGQAKKALAEGDWETLRTQLHESAARSVATVQTVPDEDLGITIQFPWGPATLAQVLSYPYWNMSYHEGQINYIASMLGCLE